MGYGSTNEIKNKPMEIKDEKNNKPMEIKDEINDKPMEFKDEIKNKPMEIKDEINNKPVKMKDEIKPKPVEIKDEINNKPVEIKDEITEPGNYYYCLNEKVISYIEELKEKKDQDIKNRKEKGGDKFYPLFRRIELDFTTKETIMNIQYFIYQEITANLL